jgi:hypothetical protein
MNRLSAQPNSPWIERWGVTGDSGKEYVVSRKNDGTFACDCPAWKFCKAPKRDCKHITRLRYDLAVVAACFKSRRISEPQPGAITQPAVRSTPAPAQPKPKPAPLPASLAGLSVRKFYDD